MPLGQKRLDQQCKGGGITHRTPRVGYLPAIHERKQKAHLALVLHSTGAGCGRGV